MKVYHGSYCEIDKIDLFKGELARDFGLGFYVTNLYQQAEYWAARRGKQRKIQALLMSMFFTKAPLLATISKPYGLPIIRRNGLILW